MLLDFCRAAYEGQSTGVLDRGSTVFVGREEVQRLPEAEIRVNNRSTCLSTSFPVWATFVSVGCG